MEPNFHKEQNMDQLTVNTLRRAISLVGLLFLLCICFQGCIVEKEYVPVFPATDRYEFQQELPRNAKVVEDLGNGWVVYQVEVLGEMRWFKTRYEADKIGDAQYLNQPITELRPPANYYNNGLK